MSKKKLGTFDEACVWLRTIIGTDQAAIMDSQVVAELRAAITVLKKCDAIKPIPIWEDGGRKLAGYMLHLGEQDDMSRVILKARKIAERRKP